MIDLVWIYYGLIAGSAVTVAFVTTADLVRHYKNCNEDVKELRDDHERLGR